jgi:hypothetical protein
MPHAGLLDSPLAGWLAVKRAAPPRRNGRKPGTKSVASETRVLVFEKRMKVGCRRRHDVPVGPFAGGFRKGVLQDWAG